MNAALGLLHFFFFSPLLLKVLVAWQRRRISGCAWLWRVFSQTSTKVFAKYRRDLPVVLARHQPSWKSGFWRVR